MKFIKYEVLMCILSAGHAVFGDCLLDRNEHNKYPWLLRLVLYKVVQCHGVLITPKYMVSAYEPVKEFIRDKKRLHKLNITAQMYGPDGEILCSASRKATRLSPTIFLNEIVNTVLGLIAQPFEVTLKNPYMYYDIKQYDVKMFNKKLEEIIDFECCIIPVFDSRSSDKPKIVEHEVTFLKGPTDKYWRKVICEDSAKCLKKVNALNFFAYDPLMKNVNDSSWYQGAAIVCADNPLAIIEKQITDPSTSAKITMFQHLRNLAHYFHDYAEKEWPKSPMPTSAGEVNKN